LKWRQRTREIVAVAVAVAAAAKQLMDSGVLGVAAGEMGLEMATEKTEILQIKTTQTNTTNS
jgi:hypothetical protein